MDCPRPRQIWFNFDLYSDMTRSSGLTGRVKIEVGCHTYFFYFIIWVYGFICDLLFVLFKEVKTNIPKYGKAKVAAFAKK